MTLRATKQSQWQKPQLDSQAQESRILFFFFFVGRENQERFTGEIQERGLKAKTAVKKLERK